jgi:hypothetical protein
MSREIKTSGGASFTREHSFAFLDTEFNTMPTGELSRETDLGCAKRGGPGL